MNLSVEYLTQRFGNQTKMADAINRCAPLPVPCTQHLVEKWVKNNSIPAHWVWSVHVAAQAMRIDLKTDDICMMNMRSWVERWKSRQESQTDLMAAS
jgi:hypothetical protein